MKKNLLKNKWYTQGINAYPVFLATAAYSGMTMKKTLGFGYKHFLFHFKNGYGELNYDTADFKSVWNNIQKRLRKDPNFLKKTKTLHEKIFLRCQKLFQAIENTNLKKLPPEKFFRLLHECGWTMVDCVGTAHVVDTIGIMAEQDFKQELSKHVADQKLFNQYYARLTAPTRASFLNKEERELRQLKKLTGKKLKKALQTHAQKYFWLQVNYSRPLAVGPKYFAHRLKHLHVEAPATATLKEKQKLISKLKLSGHARNLIGWIDFSTVWQDQRKIKILKSIYFLSQALKEAARRTKLPVTNYYELTPHELLEAKSLKELAHASAKTGKRTVGCFMLITKKFVKPIVGAKFLAWEKIYTQAKHAGRQSGTEIRGSVANSGKARGRVKICKTVSEISKFKIGEILVTSMTRPEFLPALKKAAAIITDEGGITSHAAIISRELGIPAIIGTKNATHILKDGDLVEVKANHGVVLIL